MQLEIIREIQKFSNPVLDIVMEGFTLFGEQMILAAVFCLIYWCLDKRLGRFIGFTLGVSVCLNGVVKDFFKVERMFEEPGIISRRVETATGYSFPSGHTQAAASFWGSLLLWSKKTRIRVLLAILIFMVGFSRLYLGVHYPLDVAGGMVLGVLCAALMYYLIVVRDARILVPAICAVAAFAALLSGESDDTIKAAGLLSGILSGLYFEDVLVKFEVKLNSVLKVVIRYVLGMALVGVVYIVPKLIFPHGTAWDASRYVITGFTATGLWPYIFTKLNL